MKNIKDTRSTKSIVEAAKSSKLFMKLATQSRKSPEVSRKSPEVSRKSSATSPESPKIRESTIKKNFGITVEEYKKLADSNIEKLFELNAKMMLKK
jgi:hypothetical protein